MENSLILRIPPQWKKGTATITTAAPISPNKSWEKKTDRNSSLCSSFVFPPALATNAARRLPMLYLYPKSKFDKRKINETKIAHKPNSSGDITLVAMAVVATIATTVMILAVAEATDPARMRLFRMISFLYYWGGSHCPEGYA